MVSRIHNFPTQEYQARIARTRAEMGACGAKTCAPLIARLFREEGVAAADVTPGVRRPPFVEVPLGVFAGAEEP